MEGETIKMKKLKLLSIIILLVVGSAASCFSYSGPKDQKVSSLGMQIKHEIVDVMNLPVYLKFSDKNLEGIVNVLISVSENGKINVVNVTGSNKDLNDYVYAKISSRNMWTDTKYTGNLFKFAINMNNKS